MESNNNYTNTTTTASVSSQLTTDLSPIIIYGCVFYSFIFFIGVSGNSLVVYMLMKEKELRNFTNYLLANLSIADLFVLFTCVPTGLHDLFAKERWYLGRVMCYLIAFVENCMNFASILSIFFITIDRYYVICKPLAVKSRMNQGRTLKLIVLIWMVAILINAPLIYLSEYDLKPFRDPLTGEYQMEYACNTRAVGNWALYYIVCVTFLFYVLIGLILIFMYYKISAHLRKSNKFLFTSGSNKKPDSSGNSIKQSAAVSNSTRPDSFNTSTFHTENDSTSQHVLSVAKANMIVGSNISLNHSVAPSPEKTKDKKMPKKGILKTTTSSIRTPSPTVKSKQGTIPSNPSDSVHSQQLEMGYQSPATLSYLEKCIKQRRQVVFMLMCVLCTFYVCLFPLKLWNMALIFGPLIWRGKFYAWIGLKRYWFLNVTTRIFFYLNSSINPILYNCLSKKFRQSFKRLWIFSFCFTVEKKPATRAGTHQFNMSVTQTRMTTIRRAGEKSDAGNSSKPLLRKT